MRKNKDNYEYYQLITKDGIVDIHPPKRKKKDSVKINIKKCYTFSGYIMRYGKCLGSYTRSTWAISEKQAKNNILYNIKKDLGLEKSSGGFSLVGEIKVENRG